MKYRRPLLILSALLALSACTVPTIPTATALPTPGAMVTQPPVAEPRPTAMKIPTATPALSSDCGPATRIAKDRRNDSSHFFPEKGISIGVNTSPIKEVFDIAKDKDRFAWPGAVTGVTYTIQTRDLAPGVDTVLTILTSSLGEEPVATDDNSGGGKASRLEWQPPSDERYDILVTRAPGSIYGCEAQYSLEVTAPLTTLTLHNSGQIEYRDDNGDWVTYTRPATVLAPGWRYFRFNGHDVQEFRVGGGSVEETVAIVVYLGPYAPPGWLIDPEKLEYLDDNGWQPAYFSGYEGNVDGWVCAVPGRHQELTVRVTHKGATMEMTQDIIADPIIIFQAGKVHSSSGTCTHYYASGEWRPFENDMKLLPLTYTFHFNDGTPDSEYTIAAGTQTDIH